MSNGRVANVLIIDDEPALQELLYDGLSGPDLHVTVAASGQEAIKLAEHRRPDLVVADLFLGDCTGLTVIDHLRAASADLPAVVITGSGDADSLTEASRRQPVELMTKPLDLDRLRATIHTELSKRADLRRRDRRAQRLHRVARRVIDDRKTVRHQLESTCANLAGAYRSLSCQMALQRTVLSYQTELLGVKNDDDVFRSLFRLFVRQSGGLFGAALVCDSNAQLNMIGRFGVPAPDSVAFCNALTEPMIEAILVNPQVMLFDAGRQADLFDPSIRRFLPGMTVLLMPLSPVAGELIGLVTLYRKGEQPFTDNDVAIAETVAAPTAIAIRRND